jgi:transcriptional regulator with XRE-family HTH domain
MNGTVSIGARIRELRGDLLTQQELADRADVSISLVRQLEQGQSTPPRSPTCIALHAL